MKTEFGVLRNSGFSGGSMREGSEGREVQAVDLWKQPQAEFCKPGAHRMSQSVRTRALARWRWQLNSCAPTDGF